MTQNRPSSDDNSREPLETKPFLAHLEDLRWTIIRCVGALAAGICICAFGARHILEALYVPYRRTGHDPSQLINIDVTAPFSIHMEISLYGGIILTLPLMLYYVGQFLLPALTAKEKRFLAPIFAAGALLFVIGTVFCFVFVLKPALEFFFGYSQYLGFGATWTAKALIDFEVQMLLGFGLAFEFPLVILVLNFFGIVSAAQLASKRRHAALIIFIAACCIVPSTDPITLSLMAVPLYVLYEGCVWIAKIGEKRRARAAAADE
jgi:sec-independent protein translocase protein TatC